jgi:hypothetical protein
MGVLAYAATASAVAPARMGTLLTDGDRVERAGHPAGLADESARDIGSARTAEVYPIILVIIFYGADAHWHGAVATHEQAIQYWEAMIRGPGEPGMVAALPEHVLSTLLHAVYASYYLIIWPARSCSRGAARSALRRVVLASSNLRICFVIFLLYLVWAELRVPQALGGVHRQSRGPSGVRCCNAAAHMARRFHRRMWQPPW